MNPSVFALIDDDESDLAEWNEYLEREGMSARTFVDRDTFVASIKRGDYYDAIILDWYFEGQSSDIAKLILEEDIRNNLFVPVLVYTNESEVAKDEIQGLSPPFNRIQVVSKDDVAAAELPKELNRWISASTSAAIAGVWRMTRRKAFEEALYQLDELEGENLQETLRHLITIDVELDGQEESDEEDDNTEIDVDHAIDFLERFIARRISGNEEYREAVKKVLSKDRLGNRSARTRERSLPLVNAHRYIPIRRNERVVRMGDVVDVCDEMKESLFLAVVVTPACDLDNRKCRELRLIIAGQDEPPAKNAANIWILDAIRMSGSGDYQKFWLDFHQTLCITDINMERDPNKQTQWKSVLSYDKIYECKLGTRVILKPICRLDDPYRSDLLQKFAGHAARVGIP